MIKSIITLCLFVATLTVQGAANEMVRYHIDVFDPAHHLAKVEVSFPAVSGAELIVQIPAWRTGKYRILNFANGISDFQAFDAQGNALSVNKLDKSSWKIARKSSGPIKVIYQLYANQLGLRTRHIDDSHLFLDATSGLVYNPETRANPVEVSLSVPELWVSRSGMPKIAEHSFQAANYDILADSPIESGIHQYREFSHGKQTYGALFWGHGNYDIEQIITDIKKLIPQGKKIWGSYPYDYYLFMFHATDNIRGATEHINSTVIQVPREKFAKRNDYVRFIQTVAHEFVHTWNVKAYRPEGIWQYDFQQENYTPLLWLVEGSTSYYDALLSLRAGNTRPAEYMKHLGSLIHKHLNTPGRHKMSPAQASWDEWITPNDRHYRFNEGISIYSQGELVSLLLDLQIRLDTKGNKGYEDVHRTLWNNFPLEQQGFTEADLLAILKQLTKKDYQQFFAQYISGVTQPDWNNVLEPFGLELTYLKKGANKGWLGLEFDSKNKRLISKVQHNSPAWKAGLTAGDELVALNQTRIKLDWSDELKALQPEQQVRLEFFRRDQLHFVQVTVGAQPVGDAIVKPLANTNRSQRRMFKAWSGISWDDFTQIKDESDD